MKVLIQSNKFQELAAKVSKYSFIKNGFKDVEIINIEDCDILKRNFGRKYLRNGKITKYESNDLQSFTLLRFIPTLLFKKGYCMIIDPDIFVVKNPIKSIQQEIKYEADLFCTKIDNKFVDTHVSASSLYLLYDSRLSKILLLLTKCLCNKPCNPN